MANITIWHNPRCSKSRAALKLLEERNESFKIIKYLEESPSFEDIEGILKKLKVNPRDIMRVNETIYKELNLKDIDENSLLISAMVDNPKLIERPIIIKDDLAVIARPIENLEALLNNE